MEKTVIFFQNSLGEVRSSEITSALGNMPAAVITFADAADDAPKKEKRKKKKEVKRQQRQERQYQQKRFK